MKTLAIAAVLTATLALAGCGSDSDGHPGNAGHTGTKADRSSRALTHAQLVERANAICKAGTAKLAIASTELSAAGSPTSPAAEKIYREEVIPVIAEDNDKMRALRPSSADADRYGELLKLMDRSLAELRRDPAAASQDSSLFDKENKLERELGLTSCMD